MTTTTMDIKRLNKERLERVKEDGMSHGLQVLIDKIGKAHRYNWRWWDSSAKRKKITIYFTSVTDNRLMAHFISDDILSPTLDRLVIPEAGHRLYANYKDGYQVNGGGYNKPFHILEAMMAEVKKHIPITDDWQNMISAVAI